MTNVIELAKQELVEKLQAVNKRIDDAVDWNFGRSPAFKWFDELIDKRDEYEKALSALVKEIKRSADCTDERMCCACFSGQGTCENDAIESLKEPTP